MTTVQNFGCTLSRAQRISTVMVGMLIVGIVVLFLSIGCSLLYLYLFHQHSGGLLAESIMFLAISIILASSLWWLGRLSPKGYSIDKEGIAILRYNGKKILIPSQEIASVEAVEKAVLKYCIRTFGGSGFLGNWGYFSSKKLSSFRGYWANNDSLVLVQRIKGEPFLLSPDNREEFIACVYQLLQR